MDNNTQIETVEQAAERTFTPAYTNYKVRRHGFKEGASWQKQQDEAKYKELLDSHNELLENLEKATEWIEDDFSKGLYLELINKAKNIKP